MTRYDGIEVRDRVERGERASAGWGTLAALAAASFLLLLGDTSLSVALPAVRRDLGVGLGGLEWLVNSYTLALAVLLLPGGKLADRLGARPVFLTGLSVFVVASSFAGLAPTLGLLIAARIVQGAGAALAAPAALALITTAFPAGRRALALGIWTGASTSALAIGPLAGAALIALGGWRMTLLINVPLGLAALILARRLLHKTPANAGATGFDFGGLATSALALGALLYAMTNASNWGWVSPRTLAVLAIALAAAFAFVMVERRARSPLLDLRLFGRRGFAGANGVGLLITAVMCSVFFFLSLYLQLAAGYSALAVGVLFLAMTMPIAVVSPLAGWLSDRRGPRLPLSGGSLAVAAGLLVLAHMSAAPSLALLVPALVLVGTGMGLVTAPLTAAAVGGLYTEETGIGAAVVTVFRTVGLALGIAFMGALLGGAATGAVSMLPMGLTANAIVALAAGALATVTLRRPRSASAS